MADNLPAVTLDVNGEPRSVEVAPTTMLMHVLRNDLGLTGVRAGCSIGECGACRVLIDGVSLQSCITPVSEVTGTTIVTPEGLGGPDDPHPVQQAFLDEQAGQCGYCVNGMIMSVAGRLEQEPAPDHQALVEALDGHICRCGTHHRMLRAADRAAGIASAVDIGPGVVPAGDGATSPCAGDTPIPRAIEDERRIARWVEMRDDGHVVVHPGKVELGQGIRTAFAQIVASQLGLPLDNVHLLATVTGRAPDQGQTSGSFSTEQGGAALAMAARALRRVLLARAASQLGAGVDVLDLDPEGIVTDDGTRIGFGDLLAPGPVEDLIEDTDQPRWDLPPLGTPVQRDDLRRKLTGAPGYVQDLRFDGMLHARVLLPPTVDAEPEGLDLEAARRLPGVIQVVQDGRMVVVVAEREEQAIRAHGRLSGDTRWKLGTTIEERDTERFLRSFEPNERIRQRDDAVDPLLDTATSVSASYTKPYQAHGPMSPSAAVAIVEDDGTLRIRSHTQGVYPLRRELAALFDLDEDSIVIEHEAGPGCYGLTVADDVAAFAAIAARAVPGRPVRLQLSIADEFIWDPHGPGMVGDLAAALDDDGHVVAWRHHVTTDSHSTRANGDGNRLSAAWLGAKRVERPWVGLGEPGMRNALPLYDLGALDITAREIKPPLRTGPLRSLGAFFNVFALESFMDEVAERAGKDPLAFRLEHLTDERAGRVLQVAAERAGWQPHVGPSGRGLGLAFARYKDTKGYAAEVAEVEVDAESGSFRVVRMVVACDAGAAVNPDGLRNQLEGGVVQGLSRTLHEELHLADAGVREQDWTAYETLRFPEVPELDVVLIDRPSCPPLGVGEVSTPLVPAAVANAIDDAIGIRLRALPFTAAGLQQRLLEMDEAEMGRVLL